MMSSPESAQRVHAALMERFGAAPEIMAGLPGLDELARIAGHRSHRKYAARAVEPGLLDLLLACAFSAPSKSDLQQADVVHIADRGKLKVIADLIPDMPWIADAPVFLLFCGDNRRMRQLFEWRGRPYVNEHLDHFMNAAVDAALVMMNFIRAAEAVGLGACPISAVRNRPHDVCRLLALRDGVFPVAGLCAGYPSETGRISPRLPLEATVHVDRFDDSRLRERVDAYDRRRDAALPYRKQRQVERFGKADFYGWSEDKVRQYADPEREDFGEFIRSQGFSLK